ncbi:MAG: pantoate--beta-alanine ligase [Veillonellaceae bacterium]|nr:pantoate--beta-alanine ligase [Veillonellaceae bacterium]
MQTVHTVAELRTALTTARNAGKSVGLVPTMGFLHEGHASLIAQAVADNDVVVVSVFVNPTQFGPNEDLASYPRDPERDTELCRRLGADLVFMPAPAEMYRDPKAFVDIAGLSDGLCGRSRPTHFRGVCTVVTKLFQLAQPTRAYFGEKDAQQLAIIRKLVADLFIPVEIVGCPIVREADGLAKSSRNSYLNPAERNAAPVLSHALRAAREILRPGLATSVVRENIAAVLAAEPLARTDYIEIVQADTLEPLERCEGKMLVAIAVYIGTTRLIDNFTAEVSR